jgi:hypothetical protein
VPSVRSLAASGSLALVVAACGSLATTPPAATPADFQGIATELTSRGITLDRIVAGDAGCDDRVLIPTAIGFDARGHDQAAMARIRIYIFRDRAAFDRLRGTIDECARSFVRDPATFETIEESPYVVAAQGPWGPAFEAALREGLRASAGTGD